MKKYFSILLGLMVVFSSLIVSCDEIDLDPNICKITVQGDGDGRVSITNYIGTSVNVLIGNSVEVVATPDEGALFVGWFVDASETPASTDAVFRFISSGNVTLTARFAKLSNTIICSGESGSVAFKDATGNSISVLPGSEVTVIATPDVDCDFIGWFVGDSETPVSTETVYTFTVTDNTKLTGRFSKRPVVTIGSDGNGSVSFKDYSGTSVAVLPDTEITVVAMPDVDADFLGWFTVDGDTAICAESEYTFAVNNAIELIAKFSNLANGNTNANPASSKYATRIEVPFVEEGDIFLSHTTTVNGLENVTYSIAHNPTRKHCRWTAFTFDASNRGINWKRDNWDNTEWQGDPFQPNPDMPDSYVFTKNEINRNGFVRGHIVASYDRVYSKDANEQTFYYSNISPMYSRFNTGAWNDCEGLVQGWGRNSAFCDTLYVVKGGTIREGEYRTVGSCPTVPNHYYMALLCLKNNTYKAIGLLFEHENGYSQTQVCSIDYLENFTGVDFFCNLPDKVEDIIERQYSISSWSGLNNYILVDE